MHRRVAKLVVAIIRPPLLLLRFVFGGVYKLLFSGRGIGLSLEPQRQLEQDIRNEVPSLVSRDATRIIPVDFGDSPPPFDYAQVDVASPPLKFRFSRGRDQLAVFVNHESMEDHEHELSLVLSLLDLTPEVRRGSITKLLDVDRLLREYWKHCYRLLPMRAILN